uniref:Potassium channel, subfamily K, member 12 like n=1 Tax=Hucho hucho TaxID=62062 RepID=A0A4W5LQ17_9TELE
MARKRSGGCCPRPPLNEDNARFCLLAGLILLYLLCGAAVFSALERPSELRARLLWDQQLANFTLSHQVSLGALHVLLRQYEEANGAGIRVDALRPRWDFSGAFYFVGTVVSTIGFGMTTPATIPGKIFLIFYGLIGCAATILFFNLFLERIITMLAYIMRWCHERRMGRLGVGPVSGVGETRSEEDSLEGWKPSVYYVMLILGVASVLIACSASSLYCSMEDWSYMDSLYFCFVAFSTIGFGDLVSSQRERYEAQDAYRLGNCLFILMGVCCIYSLFNVISIIIKQTLNWILTRLACPGRRCPCSYPKRDASVETVYNSETDAGTGVDGVAGGRRLSGEMISVNDFTASNKVSLALLQKQLCETAHQGPRQSHVPRHNGFSGGVGAFAIMNNRLQETSVDR